MNNPHTAKKKQRFLVESSVVVYRADYVYASDAVAARRKAQAMIDADEFGFVNANGVQHIKAINPA
jgi:hypothetical protein